MSSDLFFYTSSDDEDEVNSELAAFTKACQAVYDASNPKAHRTRVERDHYGAHDRLVMAYFSENPQYDEATFCDRFRMSRRLFTKIVREVTDASHFFKKDITVRDTVVIMNLYGEEFLRKPTYTDMEKLYAYHDEKHGFPGMLGSVDWRAPDVPFVANNVPYKRGYYLTNEIYPQWSVLIYSIKNPGTNDHKRILYKTKHEAARKDMERAFGVLKQK
ncbi:ALP1-like protein [Tanacetum coccineum]